MENRAKTIIAPCPLPCLLGARKAPSGAFTPANLKRKNILSYSFWKLIGGIAKMPCLTKSAHHRTFLFCMLRFIIISLAFLSLPCAADTARAAWQDAIGERVKKSQYSAAYEAPSHQPVTQTDKDGGEKNLHNIGPDDVDWDGFYITAKGEKIYCPEAFREKRRQYAIKKQKERDELRIANETIAIKTTCIVIGSLALIYLIRNWFKLETPPSPAQPLPPVIPSPQNPLWWEEQRRRAEQKREEEKKKKEAEQRRRAEQERLEKEQLERIRNQGRSHEQKPTIGSPAPQKPANPAPDPPDPKAEQGLAYERYIGYLMETKGHIVFYRGAYAGEKDKGVDLVALQDTQTRLIQCKCFNDELPVNQVVKYLRHIKHEWENAFDSPIHGLSHTWELYYTPWLSKAAYQACGDNHIQHTKQSAGIAPLVKAFLFKEKKCYILPGQQFYDHLVSYIDHHNYKRFYNKENAEKEGFAHLPLIDVDTVKRINEETINNYIQTHPSTKKTINRPWLDF